MMRRVARPALYLGIEHLQPPANLHPCQERQVVAVQLQELSQGLAVSRLGET